MIWLMTCIEHFSVASDVDPSAGSWSLPCWCTACSIYIHTNFPLNFLKEKASEIQLSPYHFLNTSLCYQFSCFIPVVSLQLYERRLTESYGAILQFVCSKINKLNVPYPIFFLRKIKFSFVQLTPSIIFRESFLFITNH